jgi:eukaryotic-like serine/threonine-protein kinase
VSPPAQVASVVVQGRTWRLGDPLGDGGGGHVYRAHHGDKVIAVKLLDDPAGARRELNVERLRRSGFVIPVLGLGTSGDRAFIAMPVAETSLKAHMDARKGEPLPAADVLAILTDIARALVDIKAAGVVHRDLKPANVLRHAGTWKLADFGISKVAARPTSTRTWRSWASEDYASPEQFQLRPEKVTWASDVFSFGVIAWELATGRRPFAPGEQAAPFRLPHAQDDQGIVSLAIRCLERHAGARPGSGTILDELTAVSREHSPGDAEFRRSEGILRRERHNAAAGRAEAAERALDADDLYGAAGRELARVRRAVLAATVDAAPDLAVLRSEEPLEIEYGAARLRIEPAAQCSGAAAEPWPGLRIVAHSSICIKAPSREGGTGFGHALWYCNAYDPGYFAWYELAFDYRDSRQAARAPLALPPGADAFAALWQREPSWVVARLVRKVDVAEFCGRWRSWLARAATGELGRDGVDREIADLLRGRDLWGTYRYPPAG